MCVNVRASTLVEGERERGEIERRRRVCDPNNHVAISLTDQAIQIYW